MNATIKPRLRKLWYIHRNRQGKVAHVPKRLSITKAEWLGGAASPVVLMIDDLTNAWHSSVGGQHWERGGDWGGGLDHPEGALAFLEKELLHEFPEVRATFFTVAGPISPYTQHQPFSYAAPLDADSRSAEFFRRVAKDPRFEIAYHGFNHGTAGETSAGFLQEWRGFPSHEAAVAQTRQGLAIFERAIGQVPRGGKYGGWDYNSLAEPVINDCGFHWWCRDWMPRDLSGRIDDAYYEPQFFGSSLVVALPSTVHGQLWDSRQVELLLARRQMIGIEEHISGVRPDGIVQTPNIVDDIDELRRLYRYLRGKNVWHANCTEIAAYVSSREHTLVYDVTLDSFKLRYSGRAQGPLVTLRIDCAAICDEQRPRIEVVTPDGAALAPSAYRFDERTYVHHATVPVTDGSYHIRSCPR